MKRLILLATIITAVLFPYLAEPAMAQGFSLPGGGESLQFRIDYWINQLDANLKITTGLFEGTSVNAFDTLGMDVHMQTPVGMVASYSRFGFQMEYWRNTYEGHKNLDEPVIFNGILYPAGDELISKLVVDNFCLRMSLDILPQKKIDLSPLAGIRYKRYEIWLDDITTTTSDNEILHAPLPFVGAGIRFNISQYISFGGDLGVMNVTFSEYDLQIKDYMDFHAYAELRLTSSFAVIGGYRLTQFRILAKKDDVDYALNDKMQGMFVGVALMF
jgi:hypothetical protein